MGDTRLRRPPAPADAERARSVATRGGGAALVGTGAPGPVVPLVHHVEANGAAVLLLPDDSPVLADIRAAERGELPVMLELTDRAPVDLREPVRALLWISGWLRILDGGAARRAAMLAADATGDSRLLDLGHGATLVRLSPSSAVLADSEGTASLAPVDLAGARPDPFCKVEHDWLAHLEHAHPDVFDALARHLPPPLRLTLGARVRPLGADRCGLRLRVETSQGDHDVRLAWQREATTVEELRVQLGLLVGCPFRRSGGPALDRAVDTAVETAAETAAETAVDSVVDGASDDAPDAHRQVDEEA